MFGLDPLSRSVAIVEMLLLLLLAAVVGWIIARLLLNSRVQALQSQLADREADLEKCRRTKVNTFKASPISARPEPIPVPVAPVHNVPVAIAPVVDVAEVVAAPVVAAPVVAAPVVAAPVVVMPVAAVAPVGSSEDAVLNRIASRANEINFDRIGLATAAEADDLKEIVGVGPFLERKLHSLGIYTFRQVGNFLKEDIDKVNEIIEFFPGRIERDNWVGQSKVFYDKKYGGNSNG